MAYPAFKSSLVEFRLPGWERRESAPFSRIKLFWSWCADRLCYKLFSSMFRLWIGPAIRSVITLLCLSSSILSLIFIFSGSSTTFPFGMNLRMLMTGISARAGLPFDTLNSRNNWRSRAPFFHSVGISSDLILLLSFVKSSEMTNYPSSTSF